MTPDHRADAIPERLLAVYGTLMSGFATQDELGVRAALRPRGPCTIAGALYDLGEWPTLVLGDGVVHGELFEVLDEHVFATLDPFEECDPAAPERSSYVREHVALISPACVRGSTWPTTRRAGCVSLGVVGAVADGAPVPLRRRSPTVRFAFSEARQFCCVSR